MKHCIQIVVVLLLLFSGKQVLAIDTVTMQQIDDLSDFKNVLLVEFQGYLYAIGESASSDYSKVIYRTINLEQWEHVGTFSKEYNFRSVEDAFVSKEALYILFRPTNEKVEGRSRYRLLKSLNGQNFSEMFDKNDSVWGSINPEIKYLGVLKNQITFVDNYSRYHKPVLHVSYDGQKWKKKKVNGWIFDKEYAVGDFKRKRINFFTIAEHQNNYYALLEEEGCQHAIAGSENMSQWYQISKQKSIFCMHNKFEDRVHLIKNSKGELLLITPSKKKTGLRIYTVNKQSIELLNTDKSIHTLKVIYQYSDGKFYAVGTNYRKYGYKRKQYVYTSEDGRNWQQLYQIQFPLPPRYSFDLIFNGYILDGNSEGIYVSDRPVTIE